MTTVVLVRHGENDWVNKKRLAGWISGVHLNATGQSQAEQVAERLAVLPIKAIYSSPLARCLETAAPIARPHSLDVIEIEALGEVRYGKWEGKKVSKLARKPLWHSVQFFPSRARFPQGEGLHETQFRAVAAVETLSRQHASEMIVAVSHADVIKLVLAHYLGVHIDLFQRLDIAPASISILALASKGSQVRVLRINDTGPLQPPKPEEPKQEKEKKKKGKGVNRGAPY